MSEQAADHATTARMAGTRVDERPEDLTADRPGEHPVVADVVGSLPGLDELPVTEHAAWFQSAHQRLRAVLDEAPPA